MNLYVLRRKLHVSWLIALLSVGIILGVVSAQYVDQLLFSSVEWLLLSFTFVVVVFWRRYIYFIPLIIIAGILLGLWRGSLQQTQLRIFDGLYGFTASVSGKVSEDVDVGKQGGLVMRLDELAINGHSVTGKMWVTVTSTVDIKRGDTVSAKGKIQPGFGNFAAVIYGASLQKVQRPQPGDIARQIRDWFADAVRTAVPEPEASLGIGYLVGQRRALPQELDNALKIAGLTHVVVASGYNLTILVRFARRLFEKISKYLSALASGVMIFIFMAITGMSPSMSRAGLVAGLSLAAWYYGRKFHPLVLLPFAATVTLLINPSFAWGDLGWQLSFAAFAGVMLLAPLAQVYFFGNKKPGTVRQILGETIAAQIATLPILILAFGQFSNVAVIANLLVLPFVPLAMILTFMAGIGALIMPPFATIVGYPASWLLSYMTSIAENIAHLSWAQTELQILPWHVALMYITIVGTSIYMWRRTKFNLRGSNIVE